MPSGGKGGKGDSNLLKSNNALLLEVGIGSQGLSLYSHQLPYCSRFHDRLVY